MSELSILYNEILKLQQDIQKLTALASGKQYFNVREAAIYTTFSEDYIRRNASRIKSAEKKGKRLIFTRAELDQFMVENV